VFLTLILVGQVWAPAPPPTFNPNPPIAGEPFTITSSGAGGLPLTVYGSCACNVACVISTGPSPFTVTLSTPGQYHVFDTATDVCFVFTVAPAATSYTPPATIGGTMLPINQLQIILPWLTLLVILAAVSVWTLAIKRRN